jgi:protein involved in polysaccharide export with SLBB domain
MESSEGPINADEYVVGPGDILFISISGIQERSFSLKVNPDGNIYIPQIGVLDLREKTLKQAKEAIRDRLLKSFKDVEIYVTLQSFRKIKVSLIGNVTKVGNFVISSNSRLIDVFSLSEGITPSSDLRNIKVISKNGTEKKYDLLKFIRLADISQNPRLLDGDVIVVDKAERFVSLIGQIKFAGNYEYKPNETVSNILELAGGLMFKAFRDSIEIIRFTEDGKKQYSIYYSYDFLQKNEVYTKPNDMIVVREIPDYFDIQYVTVQGEVRYPGVYKIIKDKTKLSEIIKQAGGFLDKASLINATLYRTEADSSIDPEFERLKSIPRSEMTDDEYDYLKAKSRQKVGKVVVDFEQIFLRNNLNEDIVLKSGDLIIVPEEKEYITIIGQVVNAGNIPYRRGLTVNDYIQLSGGFGWRAVESDVRVIRASTGEWVEADEVKKLYPGDIIWVPEKTPPPKFWDVFTTSLQVIGQIASVIAATVAVIVATR